MLDHPAKVDTVLDRLVVLTSHRERCSYCDRCKHRVRELAWKLHAVQEGGRASCTVKPHRIAHPGICIRTNW